MSSTKAEIQETLLESKAQYEIQYKTVAKIAEDYNKFFPNFMVNHLFEQELSYFGKDIVSTILYYFFTQNLELENELRKIEEIFFEIEDVFPYMLNISTGWRYPAAPEVEKVGYAAKNALEPLNEEMRVFYSNLMKDLVTTVVGLVKECHIIFMSVKKAIMLVNLRLKEEKIQQGHTWLERCSELQKMQGNMRERLMKDYSLIVDDLVKMLNDGRSISDKNTTEIYDSGFTMAKNTPLCIGQFVCTTCHATTRARMPYRDIVADHKVTCTSNVVRARKERNREILRMYKEDISAFEAQMSAKPNSMMLDYIKDTSPEESLRLIDLPYVRVDIAKLAIRTSEEKRQLEELQQDKDKEINGLFSAQPDVSKLLQKISEIELQLEKLMQERDITSSLTGRIRETKLRLENLKATKEEKWAFFEKEHEETIKAKNEKFRNQKSRLRFQSAKVKDMIWTEPAPTPAPEPESYTSMFKNIFRW